jgi:hypothetical protein
MVELVSNPVHVDEMVEEKITQLSSWHRSQSSELGRNSRRFSYFTSAKQMAVLTLLSIKQFL